MLYVDIPTRTEIEGLVRDRGKACVSIYLPTTPITQHAQGDRIALKNQANEALEQLAEHDKREVRTIEEALLDLVDDDEFWSYQAHSLAVFATPSSLRTFRLPNRLSPITEVSDRFHIKPLLRAVTAEQTAFVLALAQNSVRLVEVAADFPGRALRLDGMPKDAASFAGKASIKDRSPSGRIQGSEGQKVRLTQYARKVDQCIREFLAGRETPLILAASDPLLSIYRGVAVQPGLAASAITTNPESLSDADLGAAARGILDELFRKELSEIHDLFAKRSKEWRTTTDIAQAARAATCGAVSKLLVDIDAVEAGTIDEDGAVAFADGPCPASYDVVDEIAGRALLSGARVLGVRAEDIPNGKCLAAILRYKF